ncbi:MAG: putative Na+/H+ antiporter [Spirochaetota bacterium]|nr:putative Na+/H+ antiporter [Spirochaetota bacterium]
MDSYAWEYGKDIKTVLLKRIERQPFYLVATIIFLCAILHTFFTSGFMSLAHKWEHRHEERKKIGEVPKGSVHFGAEIFHFLGEVEAVFGIWAVALGIAIGVYFDWSMVIGYLGGTVNYTEPMFVVIIMTLAATRPILKLSEAMMEKVANLMGGTLTAWWFSILTIGPVLGSFITEPAAMTISALLLGKKLYELEPKESFKYATIGLLFVNVSVGGTLSHFAAPPVLMVAAKFDWGFGFMITNFGWKAIAGIVMSNLLYFMFFRSELNRLQEKYAFTQLKKAIQDKYVSRKELEDEFDKTELIVNEELGFAKSFEGKCVEIKNKIKPAILEKAKQDEDVDQTHVGEAFDQMFEDVRLKEMKKTLPGLLDKSERPPYRDPDWDNREDKVPSWIIIIHLIFMGWTVYNAHYPVLFVGGFLFFLGFAQATSPYQNRTDLKPALLVGFFLAGLVIHGGMQGWWIAPVLSSLTEVPLMIGSTILTAFNDNAAITFLSSLVPAILSNEGLQYAVVAGAVTGGGLTVIANAPNPAGQAILKKYFENGVSPAGLAKAALIPTIIMGLCYMLFR